MKRKPITLALALMLIVGAALWGINWRLDHPPLTQADKEFREIVAGADSIKMEQKDYAHFKPANAPTTIDQTLDATQTRQFIARVRLTDASTAFNGTGRSETRLIFRCQNQTISTFMLEEFKGSIQLRLSTGETPFYNLHPRFYKSMKLYLDEIAPQRALAP